MKRVARSGRLPDTWGLSDDRDLAQTQGRYSEIAVLSKTLGIAERVLLARWHKVRHLYVAPAPDPEPEKSGTSGRASGRKGRAVSA